MRLTTVFLVVSGLLVPAARARALDCSRPPGQRPDLRRPAGKADPAIPIDHIVVLMQENHSFDQYLGRLTVHGYGPNVEGTGPERWNPDAQGKRVAAYHETRLKIPDVHHDWDSMHRYWNGGKNDGFVVHGGPTTMGYYEPSELAYYYGLANEFAIADRYFCSLLGPTFPNRYFLLAGTSFGHTYNHLPESTEETFTQRTIFEVLSAHGVSWRYYSDWEGYLALFRFYYDPATKPHLGKIADFHADLESGKLPAVVFLDSLPDSEDEHPPSDIQVGQAWVKKRVEAVRASRHWARSVVFLTYDENGGYFDHVAPPAACIPDSIAPKLEPNSEPGAFDRLGFRVPFYAISPWAKRHYVSHRDYDHTSILRFIETKFNLPALSRRDANADGLLDLFEFPPTAAVKPARAGAR